MEQPHHSSSVTPEQVHAAKTKTFAAKADLSPPRKRSDKLGTGKSPTQMLAKATLKRLQRPGFER